ncbi:MAG: cytochrome c maturation protein CcmE [Devosia sp.]
MTRRKARRLTLISVAGLALALAAGLVLFALSDKITFAPTPTELAEGKHDPGDRIRLGGLVETGSVEMGANGMVTFAVTDTKSRVPVTYVGILPDLFREGQGVVAEGILDISGTLKADTVLARHDENYMPKEVVDALKAQGHWMDEAVTEGAQNAQ